MPSFTELENKYGEVIAQALLENIERYEGVRSTVITPLEDRWQNLMQGNVLAA